MLHRCLGSVRVAASRSLTRSIASSSALCQAKKKKESSGPAAAAVESFDLKKQIPVNLLKEGPEPEYKPVSEYPEWLAPLVEEKPLILEDYIMRGLENVPEDKIEQVFRTANKRRIKEANAAKRKQD